MILKPILRTRNSWFFLLQWFRGTNHQTYCKTRRKPPTTTKTHQHHCKNQEKQKTLNYLSKSRIRVFLGFYSGVGGQGLETPARIKKNHQNHDEPPKPLQKQENTVFKLWFSLVFTVLLVVVCRGLSWFFGFTVVSSF